MNNAMSTGQTVAVSADQQSVCCRGTNDVFGHPAVYLKFAEQTTVQCYYCGCRYKLASTNDERSQEAG